MDDITTFNNSLNPQGHGVVDVSENTTKARAFFSYKGYIISFSTTMSPLMKHVLVLLNGEQLYSTLTVEQAINFCNSQHEEVVAERSKTRTQELQSMDEELQWRTVNHAVWGWKPQVWKNKQAALDYVGSSLVSIDEESQIVYYRSEPNL